MILSEAKQIAGNQADFALHNMIKALSSPLGRFLNTPEDELRLQAAKLVLADRKKHAKKHSR